MFRKGLAGLQQTALPLAMVTVMLAGTYVALASTAAGAATSATRTIAVERPHQR